MNKHHKKMIAPIVVTILLVLYYIIYFALLISIVEGIWKLLLGIIPLLFIIVMIKVCIERILEIKGGEEDDLSKY